MKGSTKTSKVAQRAKKFDRAWGTQLRRRREKFGLTVEEIAARSGISVSVVLRSERTPSRVSIQALMRIFGAYGLKLSGALRSESDGEQT